MQNDAAIVVAAPVITRAGTSRHGWSRDLKGLRSMTRETREASVQINRLDLRIQDATPRVHSPLFPWQTTVSLLFSVDTRVLRPMAGVRIRI